MKKALKLITGVAATAAGITGLVYATTRLLVDTATNREQPRVMKKLQGKISGSEQTDEFKREWSLAAEKLREKEMNEITLNSFDGTRLAGHEYIAENAKRIIIAMHGWRSSWDRDFCMIADFWHANGCTVIFAEQRGQQNSGGEHMCFGVAERYDCQKWAEYAADKYGDMPIYLAGISMGASTVLMSAALEMPKQVKGIMADCGYTSPKAIWKYITTENLHLSYALHGPFADSMFKRRFKTGTNSCSTVSAMKNCKIPVLFIHGTNDKFVPIKMTYENYAACAAPKKLLSVPNADHGMSYCKEPERYEKAVTDFWREFD